MDMQKENNSLCDGQIPVTKQFLKELSVSKGILTRDEADKFFDLKSDCFEMIVIRKAVE